MSEFNPSTAVRASDRQPAINLDIDSFNPNTATLSGGVPKPQSRLSIPQTARNIQTKRAAGGFPIRQADNASFGQMAANIFTGNDRETPESMKLPELNSTNINEFLGDDFASLNNAFNAVAASTMTNEVEIVDLLNKATQGDMSVRADQAGNMIVTNPKTQKTFMINKPGVSGKDIENLISLGVMYSPAGRYASLGASGLRQVVRAGAAGLGTQSAIESGQVASGGTFDEGDVLIGGVASAGGQAIAKMLGNRIGALRARSNQGITDEVRQTFRVAAQEAGINPQEITDDFIVQMLRQDEVGSSPAELLAQQGVDEFNIPLTRGERTLDQNQLRSEATMRVGQDDKPRQAIQQFDENRANAVEAATDRVRQNMDVSVDQGEQAGQVLRDTVRAAERQANDQVDEAYAAVGDAALSVDGLKGLLTATRNSMREMQFDRSLPQTQGMLDQIGTFEKTIKTFGDSLRPIDLNRITQMRRRLGTAIQAADNPADKRQVTIMKQQFDDYLDTAVINGLFEGDESALTALKGANVLFKEYASKFRQQPTRGKSGKMVRTNDDQAGNFIEKIIDGDPTDTQVVNALFGATKVSKDSGVAMAKRFENILGKDSEGWNSVRSAAINRLFEFGQQNNKSFIKAGATQKNIQTALSKQKELMNTLFDKDEIATMQRFAAQLKRTQPDIAVNRANPSGSANEAFRMFANKLPFLNVDVTTMAAAEGVSRAAGRRATSNVKDAIRPFSGMSQRPRALISGSLGGGTSGTTQKLTE